MLTNLAHLKQTKKWRTIVLNNANFMKTKTAREQRKNDKEVGHTSYKQKKNEDKVTLTRNQVYTNGRLHSPRR